MDGGGGELSSNSCSEFFNVNIDILLQAHSNIQKMTLKYL